MTDMVQTQSPSRTGAYVRSIRWGLAVIVASAAIAWYGAYGDPNPKANQEAAVPMIIGGMAIIVALLYGAVVAPGLRGVAARPGRWSGVGLAVGIVALLSVPAAFWAGLPVALGTGAALLGAAGTKAGRATTLAKWALGTGLAAVIVSVVLLVVGNTVLSR